MTISEVKQFTIGSEVSCSDGVCGELGRVVVDPVARVLTHLVVEPKHGHATGRIVPIDLVDATGEEIGLRCTTAEFDVLDAADETRFLTGVGQQWGYEQDHVLAMPHYALVISNMSGMTSSMGGVMGMGMGIESITYDRVPIGEVEVHRGDRVHASDGAIGRVQGLVTDPRDHHVTHVLLDEGHLWGQREVAIPINAVTRLDDGVRVNLTKDEVRDLPPVEIDHER